MMVIECKANFVGKDGLQGQKISAQGSALGIVIYLYKTGPHRYFFIPSCLKKTIQQNDNKQYEYQ